MKILTYILSQNRQYHRCFCTITSKVTSPNPSSSKTAETKAKPAEKAPKTVEMVSNVAKPVSASPISAKTPSRNVDMSKVTGLSAKCVSNAEPVGPGAAKNADYKVPEYFNFNKMSYFEAEVEMAKYRLPQPNAHRK